MGFQLLCVLCVILVSWVIQVRMECSLGPFAITSKNYPDYSVGHESGFRAISIIDGDDERLFYLHSPGLTGDAGTVSFESADFEDYYLRQFEQNIDIEHEENPREPENFEADATFTPIEHKYFQDYVAYESVRHPGYYIRHEGFRLKISQEQTPLTDLYQNEASWTSVEEAICEWDFATTLINKNLKTCDGESTDCIRKGQSVCVKCLNGYHYGEQTRFTTECNESGEFEPRIENLPLCVGGIGYYFPMDEMIDIDTVEGHFPLDLYDGAHLLPGFKGHALYTDGNGAYANFGNHRDKCFGNLDECHNGFTLAFWIKIGINQDLSSNSNSYYYISSGAQTGSSHGLAILWQQVQMWFILKKTDGSQYLIKHFMPSDMLYWTHLVITWSDTNGMKIFRNGTLEVESTTMTIANAGSTFNDYQLGKSNNGNNNYGGMFLDEMMFWDEEILGGTFISDLFNSYSGCCVPVAELKAAHIDTTNNGIQHVLRTNMFSIVRGDIDITCQAGYRLGNCDQTQIGTCPASGEFMFEPCCTQICEWEGIQTKLSNRNLKLCKDESTTCITSGQSVCIECLQGYHSHGEKRFSITCDPNAQDPFDIANALPKCTRGCVITTNSLNAAYIRTDGINGAFITVPFDQERLWLCEPGTSVFGCRTIQSPRCNPDGTMNFMTCNGSPCFWNRGYIAKRLQYNNLEKCPSMERPIELFLDTIGSEDRFRPFGDDCFETGVEVCVKCKAGYHKRGKTDFSVICRRGRFVNWQTCNERGCYVDIPKDVHIQTTGLGLPKNIDLDTSMQVTCESGYALGNCDRTQGLECSPTGDVSFQPCLTQVCEWEGMEAVLSANNLALCQDVSTTCITKDQSICVECKEGHHQDGESRFSITCDPDAADKFGSLPMCTPGCVVQTDLLSQQYISTEGMNAGYIAIDIDAVQVLTCLSGRSLDGCLTTQNVMCKADGSVDIETCCVTKCDWPYTVEDLDHYNLMYCVPDHAPSLDCLVTEQSVCVQCQHGYHYDGGDQIVITCDGSNLNPSELPFCNVDCKIPSCDINLAQLTADYLSVDHIPDFRNALAATDSLELYCADGRSTNDCYIRQIITCNKHGKRDNSGNLEHSGIKGKLEYKPCTNDNVPCCALSQLNYESANTEDVGDSQTNIQSIGAQVDVECKKNYHTSECLITQSVTCVAGENNQGIWDTFSPCECKGRIREEEDCTCDRLSDHPHKPDKGHNRRHENRS